MAQTPVRLVINGEEVKAAKVVVEQDCYTRTLVVYVVAPQFELVKYDEPAPTLDAAVRSMIQPTDPRYVVDIRY